MTECLTSQKIATTEMRRDRNCITMKLSEFSLDIVPAFSYTDGSFTIPDSIDKVWLKTNPIKRKNHLRKILKGLEILLVIQMCIGLS